MGRWLQVTVAFGLFLSACGEQVVVREKEGLCGNGKVETGESCDDGNEDNADACTNGCDLATCGDAVTRTDRLAGDNGYEACDDGNDVETDICLNNCTAATCGDGILRTDLSEGMVGFEECDDGNTAAADACLATCVLARCGDGVVRVDLDAGDDGYEACDDGNDEDSDGCLSSCVEARCGDGFVGPGEGCDDGNEDPTDSCHDCQPATCGDGVIQDGERCDDGNEESGDACLNSCATASCGDGILWVGFEDCDDGNVNSQDACTNGCVVARCGDGVLRQDLAPEDVDYETCDDGNLVGGDGCSAGCTREYCGNGQLEANEACDDGNREERDTCRNNCVVAACGDGVMRQDLDPNQAGFEACDDGNGEAGDGCNQDCQREYCGNGRVDPGEACDDGNPDHRDACASHCQEARCGDAILRNDLAPDVVGYESCDDGNREAGDGCDDQCRQEVCGNNRVDVGEACDDGNDRNDDGCTSRCFIAACGDGFVRRDLNVENPLFEACDDGNEIEQDGCLNDCVEARCGDGLVWLGNEACDDENILAGDGCAPDCTLEVCGDGRLDPQEECDDGDGVNTDDCLNDCRVAVCGDGVQREDLQPGDDGFEACDDGVGNGDLADACRGNCRLPRCGDGVVDAGETCDPGENNPDAACAVDCTAVCRSLRFPGNEYVEIPNHEDFAFQTPFTIATWVNPVAQANVTAAVVSKPRGRNYGTGLHLHADDRQYGLGWCGPGCNGRGGTNETGLQLGAWVHIVGSWDGNVVRVYRDGVEVASSPTNVRPDADRATPLLIGSEWVGSGAARSFTGDINSVRIWGRALDGEEVTAAYRGEEPGGLRGRWRFDEGAGQLAEDSSGRAHHGTLSQGIEWVETCPPQRGVCGDGVIGHGEECDDENEVANDGCHRCQRAFPEAVLDQGDGLRLRCRRFEGDMCYSPQMTLGCGMAADVWHSVESEQGGADGLLTGCAAFCAAADALPVVRCQAAENLAGETLYPNVQLGVHFDPAPGGGTPCDWPELGPQRVNGNVNKRNPVDVECSW